MSNFNKCPACGCEWFYRDLNGTETLRFQGKQFDFYNQFVEPDFEAGVHCEECDALVDEEASASAGRVILKKGSPKNGETDRTDS